MASLYQNYRPRSFAELVGHGPQVRALRSAVEHGKLAHAYVFSGTRGVGKTSLARILAKAVNCLDPQSGDACLKCQHCQLLENARFVDVVEIDAASHTGVDNVREIIEHARFQPALGKYKFYIIDEVHMLSRGAFNALLKTLEEPPQRVVFVLATTESHKLPLTILSRAQRFELLPFSTKDVAEVVKRVLAQEKKELADDLVELIAKRAEGSLRDALTLLEKALLFGPDEGEDVKRILGLAGREAAESLLVFVGEGALSALPKFFTELESSGVDPQLFCKEVLELLEEILSGRLSGQQLTTPDLARVWENYSPGDISHITRLFLRAYKEIGGSPERSLPLVLAAAESAEFCLIKSKKPPIVPSAPALKKSPTALGSTAPRELPAESNLPQLSLDLDGLKLVWEQVVGAVRKRNGPLATILAQSVLAGVDEGQVRLVVKFRFHADSIANPKNQGILRSAVAEITGQNASLRAEVAPADGEAHVSFEQAVSILGDPT